MFRSAALSIVLVMMVCSSLPAQETVDLKLNLPKGKVIKLITQTDQMIKMSVGGFDQSFSQKIGIGAREEVKDVAADGNMTIAITYEWVSMKSDHPQAPMDYDSRTNQGQAPLAAAGMAGLVGQGFEMVLTPRGRVAELRGVEEMVDRMLADSKLPPEVLPFVKDAMKAQFGADAMKANIESTSAVYPDKPVKVGEMWHGTSVIPMINSTIEADYTLKSVQAGKATVEMKASIDATNEPAEMNLGVATMKMQITGSQNGTLVLDRATGLPHRSETTFDMQGNMVRAPAGGEELKIPMAIKGSTVVTVE